jgi:hypothetical protein
MASPRTQFQNRPSCVLGILQAQLVLPRQQRSFNQVSGNILAKREDELKALNSECAAFQGNQILGETYYKIMRIIYALAAKIPNPNSRGILTSGDEIFGEDFWKCFSVSAAGIRFDKTKGLDVDNVVDRVIPLLIDLHDDQCRDTKKMQQQVLLMSTT